MYDDLTFSMDMTQNDLDNYLFDRESRVERIPPVAAQLEQIASRVARKKPEIRRYSATWHRAQVMAVAAA